MTDGQDPSQEHRDPEGKPPEESTDVIWEHGPVATPPDPLPGPDPAAEPTVDSPIEAPPALPPSDLAYAAVLMEIPDEAMPVTPAEDAEEVTDDAIEAVALGDEEPLPVEAPLPVEDPPPVEAPPPPAAVEAVAAVTWIDDDDGGSAVSLDALVPTTPPPPHAESLAPPLPPPDAEPAAAPVLPPPVPVPAPAPAAAYDPFAPSPSFVVGEHRVVLHTVEGQVLRGLIANADLIDPELPLLQPNGAVARVPAVQVKAIFFMLEPGERPRAAAGTRVRVTFTDGRQLSGLALDYSPDSAGFFVLPVDSRSNTARVWVYRDAARSIAIG